MKDQKDRSDSCSQNEREDCISYSLVRPDFQTFEKSFERYTISLRWHLSRLSTLKPKEFLHTVEKLIDIGLKKQQSQRQS